MTSGDTRADSPDRTSDDPRDLFPPEDQEWADEARKVLHSKEVADHVIDAWLVDAAQARESHGGRAEEVHGTPFEWACARHELDSCLQNVPATLCAALVGTLIFPIGFEGGHWFNLDTWPEPRPDANLTYVFMPAYWSLTAVAYVQSYFFVRKRCSKTIAWWVANAAGVLMLAAFILSATYDKTYLGKTDTLLHLLMVLGNLALIGIVIGVSLIWARLKPETAPDGSGKKP